MSASPTEPSNASPSFDDVSRAVAARYRARSAHYYVRSKLRMDPVGRTLHDLGGREPFGDVVDVGCGRGQLGLVLRSAGVASTVVGFDWDGEKVTIANDASRGLDEVHFEQADVRHVALPSCDTVLLVDILHYLDHSEQDDLLVRAANAARVNGGRVIVRDVDPDQGASSALTKGWEWVTTTLGYNRGARVAPRSFDVMAATLEAEGLVVSRERCSARGMSNELLIGKR